MKKNVLLIVLLPALAACSTELDDSGTFYVPVEVETRGADAAPVETQVLAFTGSGRLAAYSKGAPAGLRLRRGVTYDILALSGCPDVNLEGLFSRSAVEAVNMGLGEYDDPGTGFAASASSRVTLTGTATRSISLAADRYVCRIRLVSVKNGLPPSMGSVVLKNAFLSNVVASQTIGAAGSGWLNPMGRAGETPPAEGHVIDGVTYKASAPGLTFRRYGTRLPYGTTLDTGSDFYCYPNPTVTDATGFSAVMGPRFTRLVLSVEIDGILHYYPVSIVRPERNSSYDISVTISNYGSDDPEKPLSPGALTIETSMTGWVVEDEIQTNF